MAKRRPVPKNAKSAKPRAPKAQVMYQDPAQVGPHEDPTRQASRMLDEQREAMTKSREAIRQRRMPQIKELQRRQELGKKLKYGGLAALGALGAGLAYNRGMSAIGATQGQLMDKAIRDLVDQQRQSQLAGLVGEAKAAAYEDSIQRNLMQIRQYAPDLYMSVAAGRRLPTGAVVLGGEARTDLLQDLGRSMADGRFSQ